MTKSMHENSSGLLRRHDDGPSKQDSSIISDPRALKETIVNSNWSEVVQHSSSSCREQAGAKKVIQPATQLQLALSARDEKTAVKHFYERTQHALLVSTRSLLGSALMVGVILGPLWLIVEAERLRHTLK